MIKVEPGDRVKLMNLEDMKKCGFESVYRSPSIVPEMKRFLEKVVTVKSLVQHYDRLFKIEEDGGRYSWHKEWIESKESDYQLDQELFTI